MLEAFVAGAHSLLDAQVISFLFLGTVIGLVFGALPGLGGVIALALIIPFTFGMDPFPSMVLLAAIMGGARRSIAIVAKDKKLAIESVSDDIERDFPIATKKLLANISPDKNDVLIVAGADSRIRAKRGAFAASWILID